MSTWIEIKDQDDVDMSDDRKELHVLYSYDYSGANYISIPIEFVKQAISDNNIKN